MKGHNTLAFNLLLFTRAPKNLKVPLTADTQ